MTHQHSLTSAMSQREAHHQHRRLTKRPKRRLQTTRQHLIAHPTDNQVVPQQRQQKQQLAVAQGHLRQRQQKHPAQKHRFTTHILPPPQGQLKQTSPQHLTLPTEHLTRVITAYSRLGPSEASLTRKAHSPQLMHNSAQHSQRSVAPSLRNLRNPHAAQQRYDLALIGYTSLGSSETSCAFVLADHLTHSTDTHAVHSHHGTSAASTQPAPRYH